MTIYDELGIPADATEEQIRQAHRRLVRLLHPDRQQDPELRQMAERQLTRVNGLVEQIVQPGSRLAVSGVITARPAARPKPGGTLPLAVILAGAFGTLILLAAFSPQEPIRSEQPRGSAEGAPSGTPASRTRHEGAGTGTPPSANGPRARSASATAQPETEEERTDGQAREQQPLQPVAAAEPTLRAPETPAPTLPQAASPQSPVEVKSASPPPALDGTWLYAGGPTDEQENRLYRPEYIELRIAREYDGTLRGEYRGRYSVPDLAISPSVAFRFREKNPNLRALPVQGPKGAEGVVSLELVSADVMQVDWKVTAPPGAATAALTFGTATLVRRR